MFFLKARVVFFSCIFLCVLKGAVVIICTVFSHAHLFKVRFCIIFICPPSCLIMSCFTVEDEFETGENFKYYASSMRTLGLVRNIL